MEQINNDKLKQAFSKIKQEIKTLKINMQKLEKEIIQINKKIDEICNQILHNLVKKQEKKPQKTIKYLFDTSTQNSSNSTHNFDTSTHSSTDNLPFYALNPQNLTISIGNGGVPTDKQTNRQTDKQTHISIRNQGKIQENTQIMQKTHETYGKSPKLILKDLDNLRKNIRLKFKRLTPQEMLVFSTLYQLEDEKINGQEITYKTISKKLGLSESSIRDYIGRLIKKKIPIIKKKIDNKKITLYVSEDLKAIATLNTLLKLREI